MLYSISKSLLAFLFFLLLHHHPSYCQQEYILTDSTNCTSVSSTSKGYLCNGAPKCESFATFRANPPYDSATNISNLLGSDPSDVVLLNKLSSPSEKIPSNQSVVVPIYCNCAGSIYQHYTPYTVHPNDTYYQLSRIIFQGLTTCEAVKSQNYYEPEEIPIGASLQVPVRCACPTANQTTEGISSLLTYVVAEGETLTEIGRNFGVTAESIREANMMTANSTLYPDFPILVPLSSQSCKAKPDMFYCYCRDGYLFDPTSGKFKCVDVGKKFPTKLVIIIGLSIGLGFLCLSLVSFHLYRYLKERKLRKRKEKFFRQNGGLLLQQSCSYYGINESSKIFSAEELQRATDNFNKSRFLGQGGFGTVYKGMLPDGTIVAIKKSKAIDKDRVEQFINEVVILSQINHRNIVKLLGCCLEIETPLLVYEYISNGALSYHIHNQDPECFLPWEDRLRIACEVAGAIAYMHSAASTPIFHRDIKPSNILLDEKYISKVSDFGTSRSVPHEKTHLTTAVQGTFGYLDPEYFQSSQFTDKSDVYSLGVVLVELLTSKRPISFSKDENEEDVNLIANFISLAKSNGLLRIIDDRVAKEAREEELFAVAMLAQGCLRLNSKKRPTMKEVAMELERLRRSGKCLEIQANRALGDHDNKRQLQHNNIGSSQEMAVTMSFSIEVESTRSLLSP